MIKRVFIRAAAGPTIGLGHIIRCIALAEILRNDFSVVFLISKMDDKVVELINPVASEIITIKSTNLLSENDELKQYITKDDILVIDGYDFKSDYQKKIKEGIGCKLVAIDDMIAWHQYADVVMNHAVGGVEKLYSKENYTKVFCGLEYALLRSEFRHFKDYTAHKNKGVVLVAMGGADPLNYTLKIINALILFESCTIIKVLVGKLNPNKGSLESLIKVADEKEKKLILIDHVNAAELIGLYNTSEGCILSASGMAIEALAVGANLGVVKTADNQNYFYEYLKAGQLAMDCDFLLRSEPNEAARLFDDLMQGKVQKKRIDMSGNAERINKIFKTQ